MPFSDEAMIEIRKPLEGLSEFGFSKKERVRISGRFEWRWERVFDWKIDRIALWVSQKTIHVSFYIALLANEKEYVLAAGPKNGNQEISLAMPGLFSLGKSRFPDLVSSSIIEHLSWFSRFESKDDCLECMRNPPDNLNIAISSKGTIFPSLEKVLSAPPPNASC